MASIPSHTAAATPGRAATRAARAHHRPATDDRLV
jgi:hypothetical protein